MDPVDPDSDPDPQHCFPPIRMFNIFFSFLFSVSSENITVRNSVPDPWHFVVDPDPDPRIHSSD